MKRVFHKSENFKDAEEWDVLQHIQMTPEERQEVAAELKKRVYGKEPLDVRQKYKKE